MIGSGAGTIVDVPRLTRKAATRAVVVLGGIPACTTAAAAR